MTWREAHQKQIKLCDLLCGLQAARRREKNYRPSLLLLKMVPRHHAAHRGSHKTRYTVRAAGGFGRPTRISSSFVRMACEQVVKRTRLWPNYADLELYTRVAARLCKTTPRTHILCIRKCCSCGRPCDLQKSPPSWASVAISTAKAHATGKNRIKAAYMGRFRTLDHSTLRICTALLACKFEPKPAQKWIKT